jgi:putative ABC transport system permease protein
MDSLAHDLGSAVRHVRRNPGFSTVAVLILALGIAAATTIFSASEALLLRPLPYPDSERLVSLRAVSPLRGSLYERTSAGTLADWQLQASSFEAITGYRWNTIDVLGGAGSERLNGLFATPEFFDVFGVPLVGRSFVAADRGTRTIVLGHDVWRLRFDADPTVVGKAVELNARNFRRIGPTPHIVLGVAAAPARFPPLTADFHLGLATVVDTIDFWTPEFVSPTDTRDGHELDVVAKLRPGVTVAQAQTEMDAIAAEQAEGYPKSSRGWSVRVVPLREPIAGKSRTGILLLIAAAGMLLLIACADVATLLLARGVARRREVAIRAALGAPRSRIVRQFLMEAIILATVAGAVGVVFSFQAIELARPWLPPGLPLLHEMRINTAVANFAVICAILTACLTGIAPALRVARRETVGLAGCEGMGLTPGRQRTSLVRTCVAAEVGLVLMLLVGTGLLVRSALRAWQVDPGFDARNLLTMTVSLPENKFAWNQNAVFAREVIESVSSLPSVSSAAVIQGPPMRSGSFYDSGDIEGFVPRSDAEKPVWRIRVVSPSYFDVMRIPIVRGRGLETRDEEGKVGHARNVVVSSTFANRYWPGKNPLGKRIGIYYPSTWWMTVVGVAGDVRYAGLETDPTVDVYYPQGLFPQAAITLIARTRGDPLNAVLDVRARIRAIDPDAFVTDVRSMEQVIAGSQAERRAGTLLVAVVSGIALILVLGGVYSVIAQSVVQRKREMAIRSALGAEPWRVIALAMRTALLPAVIGIALGTLGGLVMTRRMGSVLYGVNSSDQTAWLSACGIVLIACVAAGYLPARRAAQVDAMTALTAE